MSLSIIRDEKKIEQNEQGEYEFEHILVQKLGQSNVNSIVDSYEADKTNAEEFLEKFDNIMEDFKKKAKESLEREKKMAEEFVEGITDENRVEIALKLLEKTIEVKRELISNFDAYLEEQYKTAEGWMMKQKIDAGKKKEDAEATLKMWSKYYKQKGDEE